MADPNDHRQCEGCWAVASHREKKESRKIERKPGYGNQDPIRLADAIHELNLISSDFGGIKMHRSWWH